MPPMAWSRRVRGELVAGCTDPGGLRWGEKRESDLVLCDGDDSYAGAHADAGFAEGF